MIEETLVPGAVVSEVARRHGLAPQQLFTLRRQARQPAGADAASEAPQFVPAVVEAALPQGAVRRRAVLILHRSRQSLVRKRRFQATALKS
ncbi:transposase [Bradyrhizobium sp. 195]|uniref:transposase n=1 Tax=Bradyrhizobium sp. 195 TaxID=2782662 RepID=UPI002000CFEB|nr:transposase [Bradyrhizobium sp. 195]UPK28286.1 transposase [Bradyrhizobium sp. 195]